MAAEEVSIIIVGDRPRWRGGSDQLILAINCERVGRSVVSAAIQVPGRERVSESESERVSPIIVTLSIFHDFKL